MFYVILLFTASFDHFSSPIVESLQQKQENKLGIIDEIQKQTLCSFTIVEPNQEQRPNKSPKKSHKEQSATLSTMADSDHISTINEPN